MTTTTTTATSTAPVQLWSAMPGWGIAADLTPPELINSRQLELLRRWLGAGLAALLVVCVGGYFFAARQHSSASQALDQVQTRTLELHSGVRKYAGVTKIQGTVTEVQTQIATLMSGDVDLVKLMGLIRRSLPSTMTISSESVTLSLPAVAGTAGSTSGLDTSGLASIGTVTVAGTGRTLDNLPVYVDQLAALTGVVDVVPTTNVNAKSGTQYSVTLGLTSALISHRFDVTPAGTK